ncbi:MAG: hypothetical protein MUO40_14205 [Anaerolineaceae bacterium]|nr:hypothetical protein [Anaerolineaceae bacterium]
MELLKTIQIDLDSKSIQKSLHQLHTLLSINPKVPTNSKSKQKHQTITGQYSPTMLKGVAHITIEDKQSVPC